MRVLAGGVRNRDCRSAARGRKADMLHWQENSNATLRKQNAKNSKRKVQGKNWVEISTSCPLTSINKNNNHIPIKRTVRITRTSRQISLAGVQLRH